MAWVSAFDLGECDVYVRFKGGDVGGGTPGDETLVRADLLDTRIGTVQVINGEVVCDFVPDIGGSSGFMPTVAIVPKFDLSTTTGWRVLEMSASGDGSLPGGENYGAGSGLMWEDPLGSDPKTYQFDPGAAGAQGATMAPLSMDDGSFFGVYVPNSAMPEKVDDTDLVAIAAQYFNAGS
jgi:hypothetical protein